MKVNILGTEYSIYIRKIDDDSELKSNSWAGYCMSDKPVIVIADLDDKNYFNFEDSLEQDTYFKSTLRHEIIHAFLNESGLKDNALQYSASWAKNEEMVDWLAQQYPKIDKVFKELGISDDNTGVS